MDELSAIESQPIRGYELQKPLGKGDSGVVYKALQVSLSRPVAIRILHPKLARDERFAERFLSEARTVGQILHPNVVQVLDVGKSGRYYYYVMEFVPGRTLRQILREDGPLSEPKLIHVGLSVAQALKAGEKIGLTHRDIKPANLIVSPEGTVKLTDFGVARGDVDGPDATDEARGPSYYLSPEQRGAGAKDDIRSDIYSLGATLYHLATGQPPAPSHPSRNHLNDSPTSEPVPVHELNPGISKNLSRIILKMLAPNPEHRFQRPGEIVEILEQLGGEWFTESPEDESEERAGTQGNGEEQQDEESARDTTEAKPVQPIRLVVSLQPQQAKEPPTPVEQAADGRRELVGVAISALLGVILAFAAYSLFPLLDKRVRQAVSVKVPATDAPGRPLTADEVLDGKGIAGPQPLPPEASASITSEWAQLLQDIQSGPGSPGEKLAKLRQFQAKARGTDLEEGTRKAIREQENRIEAAATRAFDEAQAKANEFVRTGQFGKAIAAYQAIPEAVISSALGIRIETQVAQVSSLAWSQWNEKKKLARELVETGGIEDARELLATVRDIGIPAIEKEIRDEIQRLETGLQDTQKREAELMRKRFQEILARTRKQCESMDFSAAGQTLAQALEDPDMAPMVPHIRAEAADILLAKSVLAAALKGAEQSVNSTVRFQNTPGTITGVRDGRILLKVKDAEMAISVGKLDASETVRLAFKVLSPTHPDHQVAVGVFLLRKRECEKARAHFNDAVSRGKDVERYLEEIDQAAAARGE
jgi:hypothetical protein